MAQVQVGKLLRETTSLIHPEEVQSNFDRFTVLQDAPVSDLSAKAYFAEELVPFDGNPAAVTTAIDQILGIRTNGSSFNSDFTGNQDALGDALGSVIRKAIQSQEAAMATIAGNLVGDGATNLAGGDGLASGYGAKSAGAAKTISFRQLPEVTPIPPGGTPGIPPGGGPPPGGNPPGGNPPGGNPPGGNPSDGNPIIDLDLGLDTTNPSLDLGLGIDLSGDTLLDLDATIDTIGNTAVDLSATIDSLTQGVTQVIANVSTDLLDNPIGAVTNVVDSLLNPGNGNGGAIITLNTANDILTNPGNILSHTSLAIDPNGTTLLDATALVETVGDTLADLHVAVGGLTGNIAEVTTEVASSLTGGLGNTAGTLLGGLSDPDCEPGTDTAIITIDTASHILADPASLLTDTSILLNPNGDNLLDISGVIETASNTLGDVHEIVETLTGGEDAVANLVDGLLGGITQPDDCGDDTPIINLDLAVNLLNPSALLDDTPIILVSGEEFTRAMEEKCMQLGVEGYIQKPVGRSELAEILAVLIPEHEVQLFEDKNANNKSRGFIRQRRINRA